ncbi:TetR/AcrR family transcriptional regulator [Halobacteriaceae archaeon GCM10025711]
MPPGSIFDTTPDDTEGALMLATYRAFCKHGYADLTIQKIGDEFEKSTSLLYHHYDGKDDLLVEFLGYMLDRFEADVAVAAVADPWTKLQGLLDHVLAPTLDEDRLQFTKAMIELRAQAAHAPAYREAFTRHDRFFHDRLATVVADGVEQGRFRDVDAAGVASLVQTTFNGAMMQRVTTDPDASGVAVDDVRRELEAMLEARLLREDSG